MFTPRILHKHCEIFILNVHTFCFLGKLRKNEKLDVIQQDHVQQFCCLES